MRVNGTLYFVLKDHLGSANVITDASGNTVGEARYYPYGETRLTTGTMVTDQLFTGQREIAGLGIYHYGSRFYSPKVGRFLSADTIVPNMTNPQDFNRYSYVRNNPVKYTDPSGHRACITQAECADMGITPNGGNLSKPRPQPCTRNCGGGGKPKKPQGNDGGGSITTTPIPTTIPTPTTTPIPTTTSTPTTSDNNPPVISINWSVAAAFTQDLATGIDLLFAGIEGALIGVGCSIGPEGCVAGWEAGVILFNISGANAAESYLSGLSLAFTVADDFNKTGWFGDASFTSAATFLIGGINPDPIADLVIDGYASGYNRGIFNDLNSILFGAPLIKP